MVRFLIIFIVLLFLLSFSAPVGDSLKITTKGIGKMKLGKTDVDDIEKYFPEAKQQQITIGGNNNYNKVKMPDGTYQYTRQRSSKKTMEYYQAEADGLCFYVDNNNVLSNVLVWGNGHTILSSKLVLGEATFKDIKWNYYLTHHWKAVDNLIYNHGEKPMVVWEKRYENIRFRSADTATLPKPSDDMIIDHIIIGDI